MNFRLLAPAGPVRHGQLATVGASMRSGQAQAVTATWDWEDGHRDETALSPAPLVRTRRTHRYAVAGVYRVRVDLAGMINGALARYVVVAQPGQVAGSGWVRDREHRSAVPFGFLVTSGLDGAPEGLVFRSRMPAGELTSNELTWLLIGDPGSLHFGGLAEVDGRPGTHPFRVDLRATPGPPGRPGQQLAISLYAPHDVPGRHSPIERIAGPVRPGRIDMQALAPTPVAS